jgi:hypothetical protein
MAAHDIESRRQKAKGRRVRFTAQVSAFCLLPSAISIGWVQAQDRAAIAVKSPLVLVVGCAAATAEPHIWLLGRAGAPLASSTVGITVAEKQELPKRSLGQETYQLIGVADFVDVGTARRIGERGAIFSAERVNATGQLLNGNKVAVKGLYIEGRPPRINLTSVASLGGSCP